MPSANGQSNGHTAHLAELDASKLIVNLAPTLKPIPSPESLVFGEIKTDHMLVVNYDPAHGWSAPEIKPYGPLSIDPASSCLQYCPNVFEGMKAYMGPDGKPRLFRPQQNMARLVSSAARVALPKFNQEALLACIERLIHTDTRWIPTKPGYSLYIRPTVIGTRANLGVRHSDYATIFVITSPTGPYFKNGLHPISLLGVSENVRAWPGGTGCFKLGTNYSPGFVPQIDAAAKGYDQILWLLEDKEGERRLTEAGAMNVFVVVKRDDGDLDLLTPELDGTILPGITRSSTLGLAAAHTDPSSPITLPGVPSTLKIHPRETRIKMAELVEWTETGKVKEVFTVGTAVIVAPVDRVGYEGKDLLFPKQKDESGLGLVGRAILEMITDIQVGKVEHEGWSVVCQ